MHTTWKIWMLFLLLLYAAKPMLAQQSEETQDEKVRKLQEKMDQLRTQMNEIQAELDALHGGKLPRTGAIETESPSPTPVLPQPTQEQQERAAGEATRRHQTFGQDEEDAPRIYNAPLENDEPGFFHLPGTQTMLKLDGSIRTDFLYDPTLSDLPDSFIVSAIPVPHVSGPGDFNTSIRASRFMADFRIPVGDSEQARTFIQFDFTGANGATAPRLRHFYGQLHNILVGQTFTNFMDPDAFPDTLDAQGPNAGISERIPQARFSFPLWSSGASLYASAETPLSETEFLVDGIATTPVTPAPDGTVRVRDEWQRRHLQLAAVFRNLSLKLPNGGSQESAFGWGLNATSEMSVYGLDTAVVQLAYGNGIARYVGDTATLNLDAAPKSATDLSLRALPILATYGSYQHYWAPSLRSSATFSFVRVQNTTFQPVNTYHKASYSAANLIWNPLGSFDLGAEFLYGWVEEKSGAHADAPRVQFTGRYRFVKLHKEEHVP